MRELSSQGLAASIADTLGQSFARPVTSFDGAPEVASLAIDARLCDVLAWMNDDESNDLDDYPGPSWGSDGYDPTPEDERAYAEFLAGLGGGCPADELTPPEQDLVAYTMDEVDYRAGLFEASARAEAGLLF